MAALQMFTLNIFECFRPDCCAKCLAALPMLRLSSLRCFPLCFRRPRVRFICITYQSRNLVSRFCSSHTTTPAFRKVYFCAFFICLEFAWHHFGGSVRLVCSATANMGRVSVSQFSLFFNLWIRKKLRNLVCKLFQCFLVEYHSHTLRGVYYLYILYIYIT